MRLEQPSAEVSRGVTDINSAVLKADRKALAMERRGDIRWPKQLGRLKALATQRIAEWRASGFRNSKRPGSTKLGGLDSATNSCAAGKHPEYCYGLNIQAD